MKHSKYSQKIQAPTDENSWFTVVMGIFFLLGIYLGFKIGWTEGFVLIAGSIILAGIFSSRNKKSIIQKFNSRCQELGIDYKPHHSDSERDLLIGVSEGKGTILTWCRDSGYEIEENYFDLHDVLNVELSLDDNSIYKAGPISALTAAAIGGVAFGGAGAIVGSLTTGHVGKGKISSLVLKLRVNDIETPLIQIHFITKPLKLSSKDATTRLEIAEKWTNLIEVMRHRIAEKQSIHREQ